MDSGTPRRALSVRLPPDLMNAYAGLIEGAGFTFSENIRSYVQSLLERDQELDHTELKIEVSFNWRVLKPGDPYEESVGAVMVAVEPPAGMSQEDIDRLVFVIPEFTDGAHEPYRIDSYYYHRVAGTSNFIESSTRRRNVLSYSMTQGRWHGGVYRYDDHVPLAELAAKIDLALRRSVRATIRCAQLGVLPVQRILNETDTASRRDVWKDVKLPDRSDFEHTYSG
ncbi:MULTISPECIES: hypothetical protein [unclassified Stenotrophomonas]|uniref:hypothetical protein n=1 Tax=unclassified Stenotrophomonas TaxID=196198 RepID=UPI002118996F|nr:MULTISPECIES: hypothetical protein [unclassified Stenotrophomonas]